MRLSWCLLNESCGLTGLGVARALSCSARASANPLKASTHGSIPFFSFVRNSHVRPGSLMRMDGKTTGERSPSGFPGITFIEISPRGCKGALLYVCSDSQYCSVAARSPISATRTKYRGCHPEKKLRVFLSKYPSTRTVAMLFRCLPVKLDEPLQPCEHQDRTHTLPEPTDIYF